MSTCKGCGASVIWITMPSKKAMICDADPVPYWQKDGAKDKVVTYNGEVLSCEFTGDLQDATGIGYVPHWATCPCADRFRRKI